jgi:hypothetical protein
MPACLTLSPQTFSCCATKGPNSDAGAGMGSAPNWTSFALISSEDTIL